MNVLTVFHPLNAGGAFLGMSGINSLALFLLVCGFLSLARAAVLLRQVR